MTTSGDDREVEVDSTGMRALLSSLPDPGPMPEGLVTRIQAALAEEERRRVQGIADRADRTGPGVPEVPPAPAGGHHPRLIDLGRVRDRKRLSRVLPWAAAAGLVVVAGGGLLASGGVTGLSASLQGGDTSSAASVAGGMDAGAAKADALAPAPADAASMAALTTVVATQTAFSADTLPATANALRSDPAVQGVAIPLPADSGLIGTPEGARACASALGIPAGDRVVVDLGTYAGRPAGLVVALPAGGGSTAYVVGRDCRGGATDVLLDAIGF